MSSNHPFGHPLRMLNVQDARLPYWRIGQGPDLVFVHGWALDARTWRHCAAFLSTHYTCHLFDLPCSGLSEWTKHINIGVSNFGKIVADVINMMDIQSARFGLVGQDTGGSYARLAAATMPERISGMVLGNTEIPYQPSLRLRLLFSLLGAVPGLELMLRTALRFRFGREALSITAAPNKHLLHGELTELFFKPLVTNQQMLHGAASILKSIDVQDFDQVANAHPKIGSPVKFVWGRQDPWFPLKDCKSMCETFGGDTELLVLENAKLMVHEEYPQAFAKAVQEHFDVCMPSVSTQ